MSNPQDWEKVVAVAAPAAAVGIGFGLASGVIGRKYHTVAEWLRGLVAAIIVAIVVALALEGVGWSITLRTACVAVCAYIAPDILEGLLQLAGLLKEDPIGFFRRVRAALRGAPDEPRQKPAAPKDGV